jgi:hypothetical protein
MISKLRARALLGLLPLFLFAQVASADQLSDRYKIAEKLGSGAFKDVYAVEGHPELALGIFERNQNGAWGNKDNLLQEEKDMLDKIAAVGVPTATILEINTYDGKKAYLQKRYDTANRAPDWQTKRWEDLSETSIEDCHKIEAALVAAHLNVSDAQFLIGKDGHVVLSDPLSISWGAQGNVSSAKYVLDQIESAAREAVVARNKKLLASMPDAQDPVLQRYFAEAKVALQAGDAAGEAALKEALLHYLEAGATTPESQAVAQAIRDGTFDVELLHQGQAPSKPNAVPVVVDDMFPRVARDLVAEGWKKLNDTVTGLEADVSGLAHGLDFLFKKAAPEPVVNDTKAPTDPSALVKALEAKNGGNLDDAARAHLVDLASGILNRPGAPTRTTGLSGIIDKATDDAAHPVDAAGGR